MLESIIGAGLTLPAIQIKFRHPWTFRRHEHHENGGWEIRDQGQDTVSQRIGAQHTRSAKEPRSRLI